MQRVPHQVHPARAVRVVRARRKHLRLIEDVLPPVGLLALRLHHVFIARRVVVVVVAREPARVREQITHRDVALHLGVGTQLHRAHHHRRERLPRRARIVNVGAPLAREILLQHEPAVARDEQRMHQWRAWIQWIGIGDLLDQPGEHRFVEPHGPRRPRPPAVRQLGRRLIDIACTARQPREAGFVVSDLEKDRRESVLRTCLGSHAAAFDRRDRSHGCGGGSM